MTSILEDEEIGKQVEVTVERAGQARTVKLTIADISQLAQRREHVCLTGEVMSTDDAYVNAERAQFDLD